MQITERIIEDSILAPLGAASLRPDTKIISGRNWYQVMTPSVKTESLNEVIISRIEKSDLEQKVREVFAMYAEHSLPFKWLTGPMSAPDELRAMIAPLAETSWGFRGMAASCDLELAGPAEATTELLTEHNLDAFLAVFIEGWNQREFSDNFEREFRQALLPNSQRAYYLSRYKGEAAGVAGTIFKPTYGYLTSSVVLSKFRGLGIYKSLVRERLSDLRARGFTHAVTQAREATSAPILERLGFATTFKGTVYRFAAGTRI